MSQGYHIQNVEVRYDQADFRAFQDRLDADRVAADNRSLRAIFDMADKNKTFAKALHWAQSHDVKFMVDHSCQGIGGYYVLTDGVVAASQNSMMNKYSAVEMLTHEIRHAWQDYYGFIPSTARNVSEYFIKLALAEADAHAHQCVAAEEIRLDSYRNRNLEGMEDHLNALEQETQNGESLRRHFENWYAVGEGKTMFYGNAVSKRMGEDLGLADTAAIDNHTEFKSNKGAGKKGIEIATLSQVRAIGKSFNGVNYLNKMSNDTLLRKMLSPALAMTFFGAANSDQKKLMTDVRRAHLKLKKLAGRDVYL